MPVVASHLNLAAMAERRAGLTCVQARAALCQRCEGFGARATKFTATLNAPPPRRPPATASIHPPALPFNAGYHLRAHAMITLKGGMCRKCDNQNSSQHLQVQWPSSRKTSAASRRRLSRPWPARTQTVPSLFSPVSEVCAPTCDALNCTRLRCCPPPLQLPPAGPGGAAPSSRGAAQRAGGGKTHPVAPTAMPCQWHPRIPPSTCLLVRSESGWS